MSGLGSVLVIVREGFTCFDKLMFYLSKVEVEQALVEAEMESEVAGLQQEKDSLEALHNKMTDLETTSQQEKDKVRSHLCFIEKAREICLCGEMVHVASHMRFLL